MIGLLKLGQYGKLLNDACGLDMIEGNKPKTF